MEKYMQSSKSFSLEVEKIAKEKISHTWMTTVLEHCRIQEIEPDSVARYRLITKSLKDKIEVIFPSYLMQEI